jgi:hypothetical protein
MPNTSLNLTDPVINKSGIKITARIGFDTDILPGFIAILPSLNTPRMKIFIVRTAAKNFIFIFWHKCKNVLAMLSDLYIEKRTREKEYTAMHEKERCFTIPREADRCEC